VSSGSVRQHGADPDQDRVALRAQQCTRVSRGFARDRDRLVAGGGRSCRRRDREFSDHVRAPVADAAKMAGMVARGFRRTKPDVDGDTGGAEFCVTLPGNFRIGILDLPRPRVKCLMR